MQTQIVVITDKSDAHLPYVQRHLKRECIVIDPTDLLRGKPLTFALAGKDPTVVYGEHTLERVSGVWYRKPQPLTHDMLPVSDGLKNYCRSALERQFSLLFATFPNAVWVSDYYTALRASNKFLQLQTARELGFMVPDTILTGSTEAACRFLARHPKSVTKQLSRKSPVIDGRATSLFTTLVDTNFTPDLTNLHLAPAIFQTAISVEKDVRVTVVGKDVFAANIQSTASRKHPRVRDTRFENMGGTVKITVANDLPDDVTKQCIAHTKAMGLNFGAIDLVQDKHGTYWFLENNPSGQWAYIEEATGLPIGQALANMLSDHK